ncbi:hypothetical protein [Bacillus wiedmannii]|uniref:hypothetical protein n=1 Tax=Bacillus wiedmannii TaxID=1890302 RepID=UPI00159BCE36|nr:hypothetical protein [Bacillus wiedmannii]
MIKFVISYAASLFAFIFGWFLISYISHPSFIHPNVVLGFSELPHHLVPLTSLPQVGASRFIATFDS